LSRLLTEEVAVPLSEREQQLLEQMEQALYAEDPQFASVLRETTRRRVEGRRLAVGILLVLAGLGGLIGGVAVSFVPLGAVGFLLMLGGVLVGAGAWRVGSQAAAPPSEPKRRTSNASAGGDGGFMGKMEDRWRRRRDGEHD